MVGGAWTTPPTSRHATAVSVVRYNLTAPHLIPATITPRIHCAGIPWGPTLAPSRRPLYKWGAT